MNMLILHV